MRATSGSERPALVRQLSDEEMALLDAYWRAANYLSVGQIYLLDNPLLRQPLEPKHVKPRLLGHWGTTPGLNFVYARMNRAVRNWDVPRRLKPPSTFCVLEAIQNVAKPLARRGHRVGALASVASSHRPKDERSAPAGRL